jgi:tetratricopeptide (TPR) repeat protein
MKALLLFALCLTLAAPMLRAAEPAGGFDEGNRLYEEGKYADAVKAYDQLLAAGRASAALYFNRGDAQFKLGQVGEAIDSWRQAEELSPRDPDVRENLDFARTQARGGVPYRRDRWERYLGLLSLNEWTMLTVVVAWVFFALLALGQWRPDVARRWRPWLIASGAATLMFGTCLGTVFDTHWLTSTAIVTTGEADVRNGPLDESQSVFKVRDGAELQVLDRKDDWLQVTDSAQRMGWIRRDQVVLFPPAGGGK